MKKSLSFILVLALVVTMIPMTVFASSLKSVKAETDVTVYFYKHEGNSDNNKLLETSTVTSTVSGDTIKVSGKDVRALIAEKGYGEKTKWYRYAEEHNKNMYHVKNEVANSDSDMQFGKGQTALHVVVNETAVETLPVTYYVYNSPLSADAHIPHSGSWITLAKKANAVAPKGLDTTTCASSCNKEISTDFSSITGGYEESELLDAYTKAGGTQDMTKYTIKFDRMLKEGNTWHVDCKIQAKADSTWTITYDKNGGAEKYMPEPVADILYGTDYNLATFEAGKEPKRADDVDYTYSFAGWGATANAAASKIVTSVSVKGNTTVYAIWNKVAKNYPVRYYVYNPVITDESAHVSHSTSYYTELGYKGAKLDKNTTLTKGKGCSKTNYVVGYEEVISNHVISGITNAEITSYYVAASKAVPEGYKVEPFRIVLENGVFHIDCWIVKASTQGGDVNPPSGGGVVTPPAIETTTPAIETTQPAIETTMPAIVTTKPAIETTTPAIETTPPAIGITPPAIEPAAPVVGLGSSNSKRRSNSDATNNITDEEVPLADSVAQEIADEEAPLTEEPVQKVAEEISDEEVPLAELPKTGGVAAGAVAALGAALLGAGALMRRREDESK